MRCPQCDAANPDGQAVCRECGEPLTPYAAALPADSDPSRTAARLKELSRRPAAVTVAVATDLAAAAAAVLMAIRAFTTAPRLSEDATNYVGHAFGGLRAIVMAAILLPAAVGFLVLAWGTIGQRPWAWSIHAGLLAVAAVAVLITFGSAPAAAVVEAVLIAAAAWQWFRPQVRRWHGHE